MLRLRVVDSHTGGEPTRVVLDGELDLGGGTVAEQLEAMRTRHDGWRSALVCEPRGSDVIVGAVLCPPADATCVAGVIFFNNAGYLGMCGHGTIGLVRTLEHLGRIGPGEHRLETPVGVVTATLHPDGAVDVANVPAYRHRTGVSVDVPGLGTIVGDVAWGGNWFFLAEEHGLALELAHADALTTACRAIRHALEAQGVTGAGGAVIDHVELTSPSPTPGVDARVFVLCPGGAYDRSPCGTGTSARLACLAADGQLDAGAPWRQESIVGSVFEGRYAPDLSDPARVLPTITGTAHVTAESTMLLDPDDPFAWGFGEIGVEAPAAP
jgi:proline racemase